MPDPSHPEDSLDPVELLMAIEETLMRDKRFTPDQREWLIREIEASMKRGDFGIGDFNDDDLAALVRNLGPRSPRGQSGAAAQPEKQ